MEQLSNCCGSSPTGEVNEGWGICVVCKEHASFIPPCSNCDAVIEFEKDVIENWDGKPWCHDCAYREFEFCCDDHLEKHEKEPDEHEVA